MPKSDIYLISDRFGNGASKKKIFFDRCLK